MKPFARIPSEMPRSGIREIMDLAWKTEGVIHLEVGQPDFATPRHVVEATCRYVQEGHTKYIPNAGVPELRSAAARYFERKTGVKTKAEDILVTHGAMMSLATAFKALLDPGDEVLLPDPGWPNYAMMISLSGGVPVYYSLEPARNFLPSLEELETSVTPRTKVILLCTPSNPTGQVYEANLMSSLMAFARNHDLYVISDEIYSDIVFEGQQASALTFDEDRRSLIVGGVSKSYAMTGYRVGFTRASPEYVTLGAKLQEPTTGCGVAFSQLAAVDALEGPQDCVREMCEAYKRRRDIACDVLRDRGLYQYTPRGAFYLLVDVSASGMDGRAFALRLIEKKKVAVAPGDTFGRLCRDHIRISLASSEENIREGLVRICSMIQAG